MTLYQTELGNAGRAIKPKSLGKDREKQGQLFVSRWLTRSASEIPGTVPSSPLEGSPRLVQSRNFRAAAGGVTGTDHAGRASIDGGLDMPFRLRP